MNNRQRRLTTIENKLRAKIQEAIRGRVACVARRRYRSK